MKRIISLLLLITLVAASGWSTSTAFAEDNADKVQAAQRLFAATGALAPTEQSGGTISRGAFVLSLMSAMRFDVKLQNDEQLFLDVEAGSALGSAVQYALGMGIISPAERFEPDKSITYTEAFKMSVIALGYGDEALARGGYPVGYMRIVSQRSLDKSLTGSGTQPVTADDFYLLMRNVLEAPTRTIDTMILEKSRTKSSYQSGLSLLELLYDWEPIDGIVQGDENTFLFDKTESVQTGCVQIDNKVYSCAEPFVLGARVTGYSTEIDSMQTVVFLETSSKNEIVTIAPRDMGVITDAEVTATAENGKEVRYKLDGLHAVIYNGKFYEGGFDASFKITTGGLTLVDNDLDGKYEVLLVRDGDIMNIASVNDYTEKIYDTASGVSIDISKEAATQVYEDGVITSAAVLKEGTVVEYYRSKDQKHTEIRILKDTVSGVLTSYADDTIDIDQTTYHVSDYFTKYNRLDYLLGKQNTFVLTETGDVACVSNIGATASVLGYASGYKQASPLSDTLDVRLFNEFGEYLTLQTAAKVTFNDEPKKVAGAQLLAKLNEKGSEQVIQYKLDADGKINVIHTESELGVFDPNTDSAENLKRYNFENYDNATATKIIYKSFGLFIPYFTIDSATKIILVADEAYADSDAERFSIGSTTSWSNDTTFVRTNLLAYNVEACGRANILVCLGSSTGGTVGTSSSHGVVESICTAVDHQDNTAYQITLCAGNQYKKFYVPPDSQIISKVVDADGKYVLECGDFIRYTADQRDELTDISLDFDLSKEDVLHAVTRENHELNYYYGKVNAVSGNTVSLQLWDSSNTNAKGGGEHAVTLLNKRAYVWLVDTKRKKVTAVSPSSVVSAEYDSASPDKMLLKTRYAEVTEAVIYR